jgi:NTP pyrophosphatase (non-canonical NTP hydrolase)
MSEFLDDYVSFVDSVTSDNSKRSDVFFDSLDKIEEQGIAPERILTASIGMASEAGEFSDIIKKIVFQGKEVNEETIRHLKLELGDVMWYISQACMALNVSLEEVIRMNIEKLEKRYPGGFEAVRSNNKSQDDI